MEFSKIQLTKQNTLTAVYKDADGNVINYVGANIVHKDLRQAMQALIPHLAIITEQREAFNKSLADLKSQSIADDSLDNVYKRFTVESVSLANTHVEVSVQGIRILQKVGVVKMETPKIDTADGDEYQYNNDLALDIDAVVYEAKAYIEEKKWGLKEASIDFRDVDPFDGEVKADEVPMADGTAPKKRGRKPKKVA